MHHRCPGKIVAGRQVGTECFGVLDWAGNGYEMEWARVDIHREVVGLQLHVC